MPSCCGTVYVVPLPEDEDDDEADADPLAALLAVLPEELQAARPRATAVTATKPRSRIVVERPLRRLRVTAVNLSSRCRRDLGVGIDGT